MQQHRKLFFRLALGVSIGWLLMAAAIPRKKITVWMIGDSTMCTYDANRSPLTGWGMPFAVFFDSSVSVANRARGGRSTRTFLSENRWQPVADSILPGDYVLIQFGHNDEAKEPQYADRYTPVADYRKNLLRFIQNTRSRSGIPILITPVTRRRFNKEGNIMETHKEYTQAVYELGAEQGVPVVDLDTRSRELLQEFGKDNSRVLFMELDSLENPHYPSGSHDNTHFNEFGARKIAELVWKEMKRLHLELADRVRMPIVK